MSNKIDFEKDYKFKNKPTDIISWDFSGRSDVHSYNGSGMHHTEKLNIIYLDSGNDWCLAETTAGGYNSSTWFLNRSRHYEFRFNNGHVIHILPGDNKLLQSDRYKTMLELLNYIEGDGEEIEAEDIMDPIF